MTDAIDLDRRVAFLERTVRRQRLALGTLALVLGVVGLASWAGRDPEVLRARRLEIVDEQGRNIGAFGLGAIGPEQDLIPSPGRGIGWTLRDPQIGASGNFSLIDMEESKEGQGSGLALLHMEAGWSMSSLAVFGPSEAGSLYFYLGEEEKAHAGLVASKSESLLRLSSGAIGEDESTEWNRSLLLNYDAHGPSITGIDPQGASKIDLR